MFEVLHTQAYGNIFSKEDTIGESIYPDTALQLIAKKACCKSKLILNFDLFI